MKQAYLDFIKYALGRGYRVAVCSSEGVELKSSDSYTAIKDAVESVDYSEMLVRDVPNKDTVCVAVVMLEYGQRPEETIADHTDNDFGAAWSAQYNHTI